MDKSPWVQHIQRSTRALQAGIWSLQGIQTSIDDANTLLSTDIATRFEKRSRSSLSAEKRQKMLDVYKMIEQLVQGGGSVNHHNSTIRRLRQCSADLATGGGPSGDELVPKPQLWVRHWP